MIALQPYIETRKTADDPYVILKSKIDIGSAHIGIIGMGYVGLPLALAFAAKGITVLGFDNDRTKVNSLRRGKSYISHIPDESLETAGPHLDATHQFARLAEPDAILICVPTPLSPTERSGPELRRRRRQSHRSTAAARTARRAGKYDLPRHNAPGGPTHTRRFGPQGRSRLLPGV